MGHDVHCDRCSHRIPVRRSQSQPDNSNSQSRLVTNTNIEQVSDWLTKILVGVGLINFKEISGFIDRLSDLLAASLKTQGAPAGKAMALSLIVYFFVVGLIQGYLLTRLFLSKQFEPGN